MKTHIALIGLCMTLLVMGTPSEPSSQSSEDASSLPMKLRLDDAIHTLPLEIDTSEFGLEALNDPSIAAGVEAIGDADIEGLENEAMATANGELTSFEGEHDSDIEGTIRGVVDQWDLDAVDGLTDTDIESDGEVNIHDSEEKEKDATAGEANEVITRDTTASDAEGTSLPSTSDTAREGDVATIATGEGLEHATDAGTRGVNDEAVASAAAVDDSAAAAAGIEIINHGGSLSITYSDKSKTLALGSKFKGLHHLARKIKLFKRLIRWLQRPISIRHQLLSLVKYQKLRVLELKLRYLKLKLLTDAIKMLKLAKLVATVKFRAQFRDQLHRMMRADALLDVPRSFDQFTPPVYIGGGSRVARRALAKLLSARRMAQLRSRATANPVKSEFVVDSPRVASEWKQAFLTPKFERMMERSPRTMMWAPYSGIDSDDAMMGVAAPSIDPSEMIPSSGMTMALDEPHPYDYDHPIESFTQ